MSAKENDRSKNPELTKQSQPSSQEVRLRSREDVLGLFAEDPKYDEDQSAPRLFYRAGTFKS